MIDNAKPDDLCDYELDVLRVCAGVNVPGMRWGAAMSVALECLSGRGLVEAPGGRYTATAAGRARVGLCTDSVANLQPSAQG
jgi:hypothetical protein